LPDKGTDIDFPAFRARAPWWGGDLQTMRNTLARGIGLDDFAMPGTALELPADDGSGDRMFALFNEGAVERRRPLAVLVHGLTGCHESGYMVQTVRYLTGLGYPVLRLNMRGAGPSAATCGQRYHAGRGQDIAAALRALDPLLLRDGVVLVGYSLGGSILLNFLAHHAADFPVRAAATVSAPIDLAAAADRILAPRNRLYHRYLLDRMKLDWAGLMKSRQERIAMARIATIREFDDRLVAPPNGFGTADNYYAECSGKRVLGELTVPTLMIHAADDPWIPAEGYRAVDWSMNPALTHLMPPGGGHVGFHQRGTPPNWHDACIGAFFGRSQRA
jgi:predicted alpha/beta-fold hydrolase